MAEQSCAYSFDLSDFEDVARCGEYDYSWTEGILMRHKTLPVLLWGVTGGCSCNSWAENIEADDIVQVDSWQDAVDLAKPEFSDSEVTDFVALVKDLPASCRTPQSGQGGGSDD